jgi:hypothetical protein
MERIVTGTARWYLKCRACRKPWAIELPWLRVREISGFDLPEYGGENMLALLAPITEQSTAGPASKGFK